MQQYNVDLMCSRVGYILLDWFVFNLEHLVVRSDIPHVISHSRVASGGDS